MFHFLIVSETTIAAEMCGMDPSTQFLFLGIYIELTIPSNPASIHGLHSVLTVKEILQNPCMHL